MIGQIPVFVLDSPPEAFDSNIVQDPAAAIHTDLDACLFEPLRKRGTGKRTALATIEDLRVPLGERVLQRVQTEGRVLRVRDHPR